MAGIIIRNDCDYSSEIQNYFINFGNDLEVLSFDDYVAIIADIVTPLLKIQFTGIMLINPAALNEYLAVKIKKAENNLEYYIKRKVEKYLMPTGVLQTICFRGAEGFYLSPKILFEHLFCSNKTFRIELIISNEFILIYNKSLLSKGADYQEEKQLAWMCWRPWLYCCPCSTWIEELTIIDDKEKYASSIIENFSLDSSSFLTITDVPEIYKASKFFLETFFVTNVPDSLHFNTIKVFDDITKLREQRELRIRFVNDIVYINSIPVFKNMFFDRELLCPYDVILTGTRKDLFLDLLPEIKRLIIFNCTIPIFSVVAENATVVFTHFFLKERLCENSS